MADSPCLGIIRRNVLTFSSKESVAKTLYPGEFSAGPVAKTACSQCRGPGQGPRSHMPHLKSSCAAAKDTACHNEEPRSHSQINIYFFKRPLSTLLDISQSSLVTETPIFSWAHCYVEEKKNRTSQLLCYVGMDIWLLGSGSRVRDSESCDSFQRSGGRE